MSERKPIIICDQLSITPETKERLESEGYFVIVKQAGRKVRIEVAINLRDQFAMAALVGELAGNELGYDDNNTAARAYLLADAMLEARSKPPLDPKGPTLSK